jgi:Ni,Fe-hydrogenase III component G
MDDIYFGDDKELIDFILSNLSEENKKNITAEIVDDVIAEMMNYYESKGFFDELVGNDDDELEINTSEMVLLIQEAVSKKTPITLAQVEEILDLEYQFDNE